MEKLLRATCKSFIARKNKGVCEICKGAITIGESIVYAGPKYNTLIHTRHAHINSKGKEASIPVKTWSTSCQAPKKAAKIGLGVKLTTYVTNRTVFIDAHCDRCNKRLGSATLITDQPSSCFTPNGEVEFSWHCDDCIAQVTSLSYKDLQRDLTLKNDYIKQLNAQNNNCLASSNRAMDDLEEELQLRDKFYNKLYKEKTAIEIELASQKEDLETADRLFNDYKMVCRGYSDLLKAVDEQEEQIEELEDKNFNLRSGSKVITLVSFLVVLAYVLEAMGVIIR